MSDYIDKQNIIFEEIQKLYKNNRNKLISIEEELKNNFEEILELHSKKYNLISNNDYSVNPTKYYHVKSRVKTLHSFKEKLYRKNLGLQITNRHGITLENFKENHSKIKNSIFLFDDIIGLRIVTELKHDCKFVYDLIKNENDYFLDRDIIFNKDELLIQPETMKNGLPIFRIKGIYKNLYAFELQIKSKIDEAWGDMDHSLFYKDYSVSPIKNTVQITMNNVGHLFDKVENILLGLRNSEIDYKKKKEEIDFLHELSGSVFSEIKNKLGDNYDLSNIASSIKFIKKASKVKAKDTEVKNLDFKFLNLTSNSKNTSNYIKSRNINFELLILESLYWYWKTKADKSFKINQGNYENNLNLFINILIKNLCNNVKSVSKLTFLEISEDKISEFIFVYSNAELQKPLFLDVKTIYRLFIIDNLLNDPINDFFEDYPYDTTQLSEMLKKIYINSYLKNDYNYVLNEINNAYPDFIELNHLNDSIYNINEKVQEQLDFHKKEENHEKLKEQKFIEQLLLSVLEGVEQLKEE